MFKALQSKSSHCKSTMNICDANKINPADLISKWGQICLGEGSYGACLLKWHKRLNIPVEKQLKDVPIANILQEVKIMQCLSHANIPIILGVQLDEKPFSIIMEFLGREKVSHTIHQLLNENQRLISQIQWIKICYNVDDALQHLHKNGFLHCDLKNNNIVVNATQITAENNSITEYSGYLIDFGKACRSSSPSAKRYTTFYPHIAPEVLAGGCCSQQSDIFSLGTVLLKIGTRQNIDMLVKLGKDCCTKIQQKRPTDGILSSLSLSVSSL